MLGIGIVSVGSVILGRSGRAGSGGSSGRAGRLILGNGIVKIGRSGRLHLLMIDSQ